MPADEFPQLNPEDIHRCGIGQGARCCAFLVADSRGFSCGRASDMSEFLEVMGYDRGLRVPDAVYPSCQLSD